MNWYGNARHPARDTPAPAAAGAGAGSNTAAQITLTAGPSVQAVQLAASMGLAVHTMSPMSRGARVWGGDLGYGVHRWAGRLPADPASPVAAAIAPVHRPGSVRYGTGGGPSQQPGYPSTGTIADFGSPVAMLDMGKLGNVGYGS